MYRALAALNIGGLFVSVVALLLLHEAGPFPFLLLLPAVVVSALIPGSGFNIKSDLDWSNTPSALIAYGVKAGFHDRCGAQLGGAG
jgi:hypothetical protein